MTRQLQYGFRDESAYSRYYKHSGKVTFSGLVMTAAIGIPAAVVLGYLYAYADHYSPIAYLNIVLALVFGLALAALCGYVLRWGKVRNVPVSLAIIGVITLTAYYVAWVVWCCSVWDRFFDIDRPFTMLDLGMEPRFLWSLVNEINEVGTWSTGRGSKTPVHGTALWVVWVAEALLVFGGAGWLGLRFAGDIPFCENCEQWTQKATILASGPVGDAATLRSGMEGGQYGYLTSLGSGVNPAHYWQIEHNHCPTCRAFDVVKVIETKITVDKKGNQNAKNKTVVKRLVLSPDQLAQLKAAVDARQATV